MRRIRRYPLHVGNRVGGCAASPEVLLNLGLRSLQARTSSASAVTTGWDKALVPWRRYLATCARDNLCRTRRDVLVVSSAHHNTS